MKKTFIYFMLMIVYICSYASDCFVMHNEVNYDIEFMKDGDSPNNFELYSNIIDEIDDYIGREYKLSK